LMSAGTARNEAVRCPADGMLQTPGDSTSPAICSGEYYQFWRVALTDQAETT
jgi:hypothetical protein